MMQAKLIYFEQFVDDPRASQFVRSVAKISQKYSIFPSFVNNFTYKFLQRFFDKNDT